MHGSCCDICINKLIKKIPLIGCMHVIWSVVMRTLVGSAGLHELVYKDLLKVHLLC